GEPHFIVADGDAPLFSPNGSRIYFETLDYEGADAVHRVQSVNLDGFDRRIHAAAHGADILELKVSPDLAHVAFRDRQQYYVVPYRESGAPLEVAVSTDEMPVK